MALNEMNQPLSKEQAHKSGTCAWCGSDAEMHLSLLGEASHPGGVFCLSCGETVIHNLRKGQVGPEQVVRLLSGLTHADLTHKTPSTGDSPFDEVEHGIVFWEGHGWSSDGPFAGA